jgi:hypothetical protein
MSRNSRSERCGGMGLHRRGFSREPEIERIAEVADRLRAAGREVPLPIVELLREVEAAGWGTGGLGGRRTG